MRRLTVLAAGLAALSALALLAAGPSYRAELLELRSAFAVLRWAAYGGAAAAALGLAGLLGQVLSRRRSAAVGLFGLLAVVVGGATVYWPWQWREQARGVPPIHDITTDLEHPPEFVAVLSLRADAPNPAEYGGPEVAAQQLQAYPDIAPIRLGVPPDQAFRRALAAARRMDWKIVAADSAAGRIEATATTRWFGFKDDVVVRVREAAGGSRIDVRSVSRVGRSDVGTNAARIRTYRKEVTGTG